MPSEHQLKCHVKRRSLGFEVFMTSFKWYVFTAYLIHLLSLKHPDTCPHPLSTKRCIIRITISFMFSLDFSLLGQNSSVKQSRSHKMGFHSLNVKKQLLSLDQLSAIYSESRDLIESWGLIHSPLKSVRVFLYVFTVLICLKAKHKFNLICGAKI